MEIIPKFTITGYKKMKMPKKMHNDFKSKTSC